MKRFVLIALIFVAKQGLGDSWAKAFGGTSDDEAWSVQQTQDGGYIVAGRTNSFGAGRDFLVIKIDSDGSVAADCPWDTCTPTVTSQLLGADCTPLESSPSLGADCTPDTSSPTLYTSNVCGVGVELVDYGVQHIYLEVIPSVSKKRFCIKYGIPELNAKIRMTNNEFPGSLKLYDLSGNEVMVLIEGFSSRMRTLKGSATCMDLDLSELASGIYFLRLEVGLNHITKKLTIIK